MIFLNRLKLPALAVIVLVTIFASCEEDLTTVGSGVVGGEPFKNNKAVYDVFAYNKKIKAVSTNRLPIYQLGIYDDPLYGKTEAQVTTQVLLPSGNPTFGVTTQTNEDDPSSVTQIPENETIDSVYLYIPFLTNPTGDADLDGLIDELDDLPLDPNSDTDEGGLTDSQENSRGSNPLDASDDTDDTDFVANQFAKTFDLDSIYVDGRLYSDNMPNPGFNLKVQRSTYFLRDLDPSVNFQEAQEYYSSQEFAPTFVDEVIYDSEVSSEPIVISSEQIPLRKTDDESTEDVDESTQFSYLSPGIRVALDKVFFQENILDKEGSTDLESQANFKEFLRGLHFSVSSGGNDVMFLFNLKLANITVSYSYDTADSEGVVTAKGGQTDLVLNFLRDSFTSTGQLASTDGNAVNTFVNEVYPPEITDKLDTGENASEIYLKGGAGTFAEIKLFDEVNGLEVINEIKSNNWIINDANLVFYVADENLGVEPPRLYLFNSETNAILPLSATDADGLSEEYGGIIETSSDGEGVKYTVNVTTYINNLVLNDADNVTLGLTTTPSLFLGTVANAMLENGEERELPLANTLSPLGTVLYGSAVDANEDKKLQLEIFYTETN
ncbi:DUF4270 domain-containing protein [Zobellia alginiliquefaciens]|uniref:DUF4270 domain-containing protein n=1 Tax=Zobellia alginiliquefaciens TaxID=3032586 RepID=UPI0023E3BF1B|nr:DUF4270 domain-containing protein [Zobellia alginiliquefaciens]